MSVKPQNSFEDNLIRLEKIIDDLHSEKMSLEVSLKKFEDGVRLADACMKTLETMRKKVDKVVRAKNGQITLVPFEQKPAGETEKA